MEPTVIQISDIQGVIGIIVFVATAGIAWGTLKNSVKDIDTSLKEMKPDLKNIRERFVVVEDRVKTLWKDEVAPAHSPRKLNDRGNTILSGSGIKEIVEEKKNDFLSLIKQKSIKNPYDAEQCILQIVNELKNDSIVVEKLKAGAFAVGADIDTILLVGGLHLRDLIFPDLGFSIEEIDHTKPKI